MGLILAIIAAIVVKVIADDVKEWTPWIARRFLAFAVRCLPESQRERYIEEWAAHLAEVPGVIGKLALSLQFLIAAVGAREMDAKARLDAWRDKQTAVLTGIRILSGNVLALVELRRTLTEAGTDEAVGDTLDESIRLMQGALIYIVQRCDELDDRRPALGITVAAAIMITEDTFDTARVTVMMTARKAKSWPISLRHSILRTLGRLDL